MIRVFILDKICLNVDNETDAQNLLEQGAKEVEDLSIFQGYENMVSPENTLVNDDGSITFTLPSDEQKIFKETELINQETIEMAETVIDLYGQIEALESRITVLEGGVENGENAL